MNLVGYTLPPCSAGWSWRLELEWCERKILLPGWWLELEGYERKIVLEGEASTTSSIDDGTTPPHLLFRSAGKGPVWIVVA